MRIITALFIYMLPFSFSPIHNSQQLSKNQSFLKMTIAKTYNNIMSRIRWMVSIVSCYYLLKVAESDSGINELEHGCSNYNVTSVSDFTVNLNATYKELGALINNGSKFATAEQLAGSDPVYTMIQCRDYMSRAECTACFTAAKSGIRKCASANGGRVIYDGCFLRYERIDFYGEGTTDANKAKCGNRTISTTAAAYQTTVQGLLTKLQIATPRINNLYAASKEQVTSSTNASVYAIAQCARTLTSATCGACLQVAVANLQTCGNADGKAIDSGCYMRYSDQAFFADNQTIALEPYLKTKNSSKKGIIIGASVGGASLIILLVALFIWYKLSSKKKANPRGDLLGATELRGPTNFSYKDLKSATKNFKEENKLGEGGFGDVYRGTLKNGKIVAVKKLAVTQSARAKEDFKSEVTLICNVHHRNLVRLLGCCSKGPELLLVYEYMANSSLDRFLFGNKRGSLNWQKRFDIILGTAQGLAYLHEQFHVCIIHRDIKPGNILLDNDFHPKIADFGLARLLPENQSHVSTRFAGTLGYTAPEYAIHGQLSEKVDTYSYGVVVLEIISGRKSSEMIQDPGAEYLLKRAWKLYENEKPLELVDESLDPNEYEAEDMKRIIEIALTCTQSSPTMRPTMSEVVVLLKSKGFLENKPLSKPPFIESGERIQNREDKSVSSASSNSKASISITEMSGR